MKKTTKLLLVLSLALLLALSALAFFACKPTVDPKLDVTVASNTDVKVGDSLDSVKQYLTVEYTDSNNKTFTVTDYELQGALTEGQITLTVKYQGLTATCNITVKSNTQQGNDKPTKPTVTVNTNGGTFDGDFTVNDDGTLTKPTDPVKDGYEFIGWCKDEECTLEWNFAIDTATQDITLNAKWNAKSYSVTFVAEGNTVATQDYTVENKNILEPAVPVKEGYTGKWEEYSLTTGDKEVKAVYTAKTYTVTLDYNGATENNTQQTITVTYDQEVGELPEPEKTGYYFYGWRYANELITSSTIWKFDVKDATLTVKWQAKIYTVTFVSEKLTLTANYTVESKPVEPAVPVKEGYDGVWEDYTLTTGDITVNAIYVPITYTVTFVSEETTVDTQNYTVENKNIVEPAIPAKTGYDGSWENYSLTIGNIIVNTVYTAKQYDVVLDYGGATGNNTQQSITVTYDKAVGAIPTPTKTGYLFEGWKYDGDTVTASTVWKTDTTSAITFTADWSGPYYTVTFDSNGGSEVSNLANVLNGSLITEPQTPTKDMADFSGWYSDSEFNNKWNFEADTVSDNITLYAKWLNYTQGLTYTLNNDKTAYSVTGLGTAQDSDIIITPVYNGKPVTSIDQAFANCNSVQSVVIPDSVTAINDGAFFNCSGLTSITIGKGVETIGYNAFQNCSSFASVYYNGDILKWCEILFYGITSNPLYCADNLYIGNECVTNGELIIPSAVTKIGDYSFVFCKNITSVTIHNSTTTIGEDAFVDCDNLTSVFYTGSLSEWCNINFATSRSNPLYYAHNLYIDNKCVTDGELIITDAVEIKDYVFYGCTGITTVTISDGLTTIGYEAFRECSSLRSISIPDSITTVDVNPFLGCNNLQYAEYSNALYLGNANNPYLIVVDTKTSTNSYSIHNDTKVVGSGAFSSCKKITSIIIPDGVTTICRSAFTFCESLKSVTIPASVTTIGENLFLADGKLTTIMFSGTIDQWNAIFKDDGWNRELPATKVICSDGEVAL